MARRFAYISFGILCLTAAYQLGAERARAEWNEGGPGAIIGIAINHDNEPMAYMASGDVWALGPNANWFQGPTVEPYDLPVPADGYVPFSPLQTLSR